MIEAERRVKEARLRAIMSEADALMRELNPSAPPVRRLSAINLPDWVRQGLADAIRTAIADETPTTH